MLVKHVPGTCGVRAGRGGASCVETLRMVYSTHAARSRFWLHKMLWLRSRRGTLPKGLRKNLAVWMRTRFKEHCAGAAVP